MGLSHIQTAKSLLKWTLIFMQSYFCFLCIRDTDCTTFENRLREALKFLELHSHQYRLFVWSTLDPNIVMMDGFPIGDRVSAFAELSTIKVVGIAHLSAFSSVFLVLNSRFGCVVSFILAIGQLLMFNFHVLTGAVRPYIEQQVKD